MITRPPALKLLLALCLISTAASVVLEANPDDVLPDGTPKHWAFTRNGTLKVLVVRVRYPDDSRAEIEIAGNLNNSMLDTAVYYRDSSYNKLDLEFTYTNVVTLASTVSTATASSVKSEALAALEDQGYHYCGGPCETAKATDGGNLRAREKSVCKWA